MSAALVCAEQLASRSDDMRTSGNASLCRWVVFEERVGCAHGPPHFSTLPHVVMCLWIWDGWAEPHLSCMGDAMVHDLTQTKPDDETIVHHLSTELTLMKQQLNSY